jgi:hypothetical protein
MIDPLAHLQGLLSVLYGPHDAEEQEASDRALTALRQDASIVPLCVHILDSAADGPLPFFAASTVAHHLLHSAFFFSRGCCCELFQICARRISSPLSAAGSVTERKAIECMALVATRFVPELLADPGHMGANQRVVFFDAAYCLLSDCVATGAALCEYATGPLLRACVALLLEAEVTEAWFSLHRRAIGAAPDFAPFAAVLPRVRAAAADARHLPGLLDLFECVLRFEPINVPPPQLRYVVDFMCIALTAGQRLLLEGDRADMASFVWAQVLEYSFDFFGHECIVPFARRVFREFVEALPRMGADLPELVELAAHLFGQAARRDFANFGAFAARLLAVISQFVTLQGGDFKDARLERAIAAITQWEMPQISAMLRGGAATPSPGLFYVIAYASKGLRATVARSLVPHIGETTPAAALSFIAKCCKHLGPWAGALLEFAYALLPEHPTQGLEAVKSLARRFPRLFADDAERFLMPLLEPLAVATHAQAGHLIAAIFYVFPVVQCEIPTQTWERLGQLILPFFRALAEARDFCGYRDFAIAILKCAVPACNPPFFHALGDAIAAVFRGAAGSPHDLCLLLEVLVVCLRQGILADPAPAFEVALEVLREGPTAEVFALFAQCPHLVAPGHLEGVDVCEDIRLLCALLEFLAVYCRENPEAFAQCVMPDWLFELLEHSDERVVVATLGVLEGMLAVDGEQPTAIIARVLATVPSLMLCKLGNPSIAAGLSVLMTIAGKPGGIAAVLEAMSAIAGTSSIWDQFVTTFRGDTFDRLLVITQVLARDVRALALNPTSAQTTGIYECRVWMHDDKCESIRVAA